MAIATIAEQAYRGDTVTFDVINIKRGGVTVPFTAGGYSFWCTGKRAVTAADVDAVFQVTGTVGAKGSVTAPIDGKLSVKLLPPATSALAPVVTDLQVDVQYKDPAGDVWTVASGVLTILPDVTVAS